MVNATRIGSVDEDTVFTNEIVSGYQAVADVTFGNPVTNLTTLGKDNGLVVVNGWDMFTHQAAVLLKHILGHSANIDRLRHFVSEGLAASNHGATVSKNNGLVDSNFCVCYLPFYLRGHDKSTLK